MGMNIKSDEAHNLAREIARHVKKQADFEERRARVEDIIRRSGPTAPGVTSDHFHLYDEQGLPK